MIMKYLASSIKTITILQVLITLGTLIGMFFVDFSITNLFLSLIFYFLYSGVGLSMMLHRYFTHKSFEFKSEIVKYICIWFSITASRGSILGWVYIHRLHHLYSDTEKDPHSPNNKSWRVMFPHLIGYPDKVDRAIIRDLFTREQINIDKYYIGFILIWVLFLSLFGFSALFFAWLLPVYITKLVWNIFIYAGHVVGYRNHETDDSSKNCMIFSLLLWGEGLHNNHHNNARLFDLREKWHEVDITGQLIKLIKK